MRKIMTGLALCVLAVAAPTAGHAAHVVYVPIYVPGHAVNPEHAVGNAEASEGADTPEFKAFLGCDGYGRIAGDSDEINRIWIKTWLTKGSHFNVRYQTQPKLGPEGVAACTRALADPVLDDRFVTRRAHLLLYRALHQIHVGDPEAAEADVKAAETLLLPLAGDTVVQRGLGVDAMIVGAYAAYANDDKARMADLVGKVVAARPFATQVLFLGGVLEGYSAKAPGGETWQKLAARLAPNVRSGLALAPLYAGKFGEFLDIWPIVSDAHLSERSVATLANNEGLHAYALAAQGRAGEATAVLATARETIAARTPALLPPPPDGTKEGRKETDERARIEAQHIAGQAAAIAIAKWGERIALRAHIATAGVDDFGTVKAEADGESEAVVKLDYLRLLRARFPKQFPASPVAPPPMVVTPTGDTTDVMDLAVLNAMLHPESWGLIPQGRYSGPEAGGFKWGGFKWINGGSCQHDAVGPATRRYTCYNDSNTPDVIGEMVLINAALDARAAGKTGLVIHGAQNTRHFVERLNNGYDVKMDIDFVDRAALPDAFKPVDWAVIGVDEVFDALMPFYARLEPRT